MRWTELSPNGRRRKAQHQTRNRHLCRKSYTTQPRHTLASQTENTRTDSTPKDQELQTLMSRRDQAYQRVLETGSTRYTTGAYKDACRRLQKRTLALKSDCHSRQDLRQDLLNRLSTHITPEVVSETQCGFKGNRSTVDMIFCLRQLNEKYIEQDRTLHMVFVDFSKAFDTVGRTGLW
ncbi:hypothetical protein NP493_946g00020 [Ridgeia piscesae]|uniref:Reverse transcriptase domain-containing protein n=1 Tax=Ridgeia piscesae TaxID=27915 RepID=A0AAD9NLF2_RIDPI|nr:hypothetical protein NP493_946g00020 [Ridgeia piscesae]